MRPLTLLLLLLAAPLSAQVDTSLVGSWQARQMVTDRVSGQPVLLVATITFAADSTFVSGLTSHDGSGDVGSLPQVQGTWTTARDPWGHAMLCVRRVGASAGKCQPYEFVGAALVWNDVGFLRLTADRGAPDSTDSRT